MTTPITSDKILTPTSPKTGDTDAQSAKKSVTADQETTATSSEASAATEETVNIDRATQLYHITGSEPAESSGNLKSPEEARELIAHLIEQLTENESEALLAHTGVIPDHIAALLSGPR